VLVRGVNCRFVRGHFVSASSKNTLLTTPRSVVIVVASKLFKHHSSTHEEGWTGRLLTHQAFLDCQWLSAWCLSASRESLLDPRTGCRCKFRSSSSHDNASPIPSSSLHSVSSSSCPSLCFNLCTIPKTKKALAVLCFSTTRASETRITFRKRHPKLVTVSLPPTIFFGQSDQQDSCTICHPFFSRLSQKGTPF